MEIKIDDLSGPEIARFLEEHIKDMRSVSPPESKHALDVDGLRKPEITFWTVWDHGQLVGCGALREIDATHGEIKSMRTSPLARGKGVASLMLQHLIDEGRKRNYKRLSLETGAMPFFKPAHALYAKFGFVPCAPFLPYKEDPNSLFLSKELS
jgi:putative acetyltransferase